MAVISDNTLADMQRKYHRHPESASSSAAPWTMENGFITSNNAMIRPMFVTSSYVVGESPGPCECSNKLLSSISNLGPDNGNVALSVFWLVGEVGRQAGS